jgi:hypothetical protein
LAPPHSLSAAAANHGLAGRREGYSAAMMVEESRIVQGCIFHTLPKNLDNIGFSVPSRPRHLLDQQSVCSVQTVLQKRRAKLCTRLRHRPTSKSLCDLYSREQSGFISHGPRCQVGSALVKLCVEYDCFLGPRNIAVTKPASGAGNLTLSIFSTRHSSQLAGSGSESAAQL